MNYRTNFLFIVLNIFSGLDQLNLLSIFANCYLIQHHKPLTPLSLRAFIQFIEKSFITAMDMKIESIYVW